MANAKFEEILKNLPNQIEKNHEIPVRIASLWAEAWTQKLQNMRQGCYSTTPFSVSLQKMKRNLTISGKYPVQIKADELSRLRNYKAFISPLRLMSALYPYTCHKEPLKSRHQKSNMKIVLYQGWTTPKECEPLYYLALSAFLCKKRTEIIMLKIVDVYKYITVPCINQLQQILRLSYENVKIWSFVFPSKQP